MLMDLTGDHPSLKEEAGLMQHHSQHWRRTSAFKSLALDSSEGELDPDEEHLGILSEDPAFLQWAEELGLSGVDMQALQNLESSKPWRARLRHQMLCWEAQ